ncbi:MAG: integration host factor subunit beta [Aquificae bacterium]|nr:integration host factor subunit beta [Aquificota bacterium]
MNKSEIARELARRKGISLRKATLIVNLTFEVLKEAVLNGEKVEIRGLGTFRLKRKPGRFVKNPKTGIEMYVKEKYVPTFKVAKSLRKKLNGKE